MVAVAAIWVKAPVSTQGQNTCDGLGNSAPIVVSTPARKRSANGKPNRKRTWVAPTVPSLAVSSRCVALRTVCAAAAMIVNSAQSHEGSNIGTAGRLAELRYRMRFAACGPFGDAVAGVIHHHQQ